MAARNPRLNDRQTAVLLWIAEGCPEGRWEGYAHRVSAAALRSRGLVRISGRGQTWTAELTDAGRDFLEAVDHEGKEGIGPDGESDAVRSGAHSDKASTEPRASKTEKLVHDVVAANGTLRLPDERSGVDYRQRAYAAQRSGKVPEGKHLAVARVGDEFEISLRDGAGTTTPEGELRVPARVGRYHGVARQLRQRTAIQEVSRAQLTRSLRIVHTLAVEIERRGHRIDCVDPGRDSYGRTEWKGSNGGQLEVTIDGHSYRLRICEKGVGIRGAWEEATARRKEALEHPRSYGWFPERPKPYDADATGVLEISINGGYGRRGRQSRWGDRKRWSLEDRLPQVLHELEIRAVEDEERRVAFEREREERQRRWEEAMRQAEARFLEDHRLEVLRTRVRLWREADAIREYCDAVEARHEKAGISADSEAKRWLELAREYADRAQELPRMPADPSPRPEDLRPYLGGLSPYGLPY